MKTLIYLLAASSDSIFHDWCSSVGIETPAARLVTTPESVAGRGVFATEDVEEGDTVIRIPHDTLLHEYNAAVILPEVTKKHKKTRRRYSRRQSRLLRPFGKKYEFAEPSDLWQAEFTQYCLSSLESNNFWAPWIQQWQRDDPMQRLFERNVSPDDENSIIKCIAEIKKDLLPNEDPLKIRAAVDIRLRRLAELKELYGLADSDSSMYGTVISRAIDLGDGTLAVIPMFDMVNHSMNPNLNLSIDFEHEMLDMKATRPIKKGEEMFVSYHDEENQDNEFGSLWSAVQWGIPEAALQIPEPQIASAQIREPQTA
ncbi:unnamed protein product [Cylindrotheca closterium]|uniref:SET domain-containing protein n=1 Tax=Cylindrotheca closterium TaxID=2856 RepID=A0AAD2CG30_9STRA|nr:unnamed protein product [Cylindrotheca closterium]